MRVVVVDDDRRFLDTIAEAIGTAEGFDVVGAASTVDDAIRLIDETKPDAAVVDARMPDGGGERVVRTVADTNASTCVVMLSGYNDPRTVSGLLDAGAACFVTKGASLDDVLDAILTSLPTDGNGRRANDGGDPRPRR